MVYELKPDQSKKELSPEDKATAKKIFTYVGIGIAGFVLGVIASPSSDVQPVANAEPEVVTNTVEKRVEVTPASCKRAIEIDNETFIAIGNALPKYQFSAIVDHINSVKDERLAVVEDCLSK